MSRDVDPCNCDQACEYADLLQQANIALHKLVWAVGKDTPATKYARITAENIGACLDKYDEATKEYAGDEDTSDNEYEPPNER